MLVWGVGVFIGKAEADENTWHFEGVVHLGDEGDGTAFTNEHRFFAKTFLQSGLGHLENRSFVGRHPGFARAQHFAKRQWTPFGSNLRMCFSTSLAIFCGF